MEIEDDSDEAILKRAKDVEECARAFNQNYSVPKLMMLFAKSEREKAVQRYKAELSASLNEEQSK